MNVHPVLQAIVLADYVYFDAPTGKKVIAGTFNHLSASNFPSNLGVSKYVFLSMSGIHGEVALELSLVDLKDGSKLMEIGDLEMESSDPLDTVEMVVELPSLPLPHPGVFSVEVSRGNEVLGSIRLIVSDQKDMEMSDEE